MTQPNPCKMNLISLFNFLSVFLLSKLYNPRQNQETQDYCSVQVDVQLICKGQAKVLECPAERQKVLVKESKTQHTAGGAAPVSAASLAAGLLEPEATHTVGSLLPSSPSQAGSYGRHPNWEVAASQQQVPPDTCVPSAQPGQASLSPGRGDGGAASSPGEGAPGTTHPHQLPASCCHHSDGHLEGRGQRSLSDPQAKRRKAPGGRLKGRVLFPISGLNGKDSEGSRHPWPTMDWEPTDQVHLSSWGLSPTPLTDPDHLCF